MAALVVMALMVAAVVVLPLIILRLAIGLVFLPFKLLGVVLRVVFGVVGLVFKVLFSGVGLVFGLLAAVFFLVLLPPAAVCPRRTGPLAGPARKPSAPRPPHRVTLGWRGLCGAVPDPRTR